MEGQRGEVFYPNYTDEIMLEGSESWHEIPSLELGTSRINRTTALS